MAMLANQRATLALIAATLRYRLSVAAIVRTELARFERHADAIEEPRLRSLALSKLRREGFNAAAAAMLATLMHRRGRAHAAQAIVALEVLFDYLDGRTEAPVEGDSIGWRRAMLAPLLAAVSEQGSGSRAGGPRDADAKYLRELVETAQEALASLRLSPAIRARMLLACKRAVEAQTRIHAAGELGSDQLEQWARASVNGTGLGWREQLAGAGASVLSVHALIASSDREQGAEGGRAIDDVYMHIGALATLLDGIVDRHDDSLARRMTYTSLFDAEELEHSVLTLSAAASARTLALDRGTAHRMVLAGVLAYYTTAPAARGEPTLVALREQEGALLAAAAMVLSTWRTARGRSDAL